MVLLYELSLSMKCKKLEELLKTIAQKSSDFKEYLKKYHQNNLDEILADFCLLNTNFLKNKFDENKWIVLYSWDNGDYSFYNLEDNKVYILKHDSFKNNAKKFGINLRGELIYWKDER
jgi:hypothetical protein